VIEGLIDRLLDGLWPTRRQPAPVMASAATGGVVLARGAAAAIDLLLCFVLLETPLLWSLGVVVPGLYDALGGYVVAASLLLLLPIYSTYSFYFEWRYGRTPGKVNRRLVVVKADGSRLTLRGAAVRNLLRYVDLLGVPPFVLGLLVALLANGRRVGDLAADTRVVNGTVPDD
jgi:uncharacterized RDD family membrane protein YckC